MLPSTVLSKKEIKSVKFEIWKSIMGKNSDNDVWKWEILPSSGWLEFKIREIWLYRDLIVRLVKRDFLAIYKQTILGPLWIFIQPLLMTFMFVVIFDKVANIPTDGLPPLLFYLSGIILWNYFSECLMTTSTTFLTNANIFSKVYFPRLVVPLSVVLSQFIRFFIQMLLFFLILIFYIWDDVNISPNRLLLISPFLVVMAAGLGLGSGLIISSLTAKYRDLNNLISFGIRLLMYATPVIYPLSIVPDKYKLVVWLNPVTPLIEGFRFAFLGTGTFDFYHLLYSFICMLILLFIGIALFNKMEQRVMDIV